MSVLSSLVEIFGSRWCVSRWNWSRVIWMGLNIPVSYHLTLIGTTTRTSQNEAFNRVKLIYTSKLIDYTASYQTRYALAILHNNEGFVRW